MELVTDKELKLCKDRKFQENFKVKDVGRVFKTKIVLTHSLLYIYIYILYYYSTVLFTEKPFSGVFIKVELI